MTMAKGEIAIRVPADEAPAGSYQLLGSDGDQSSGSRRSRRRSLTCHRAAIALLLVAIVALAAFCVVDVEKVNALTRKIKEVSDQKPIAALEKKKPDTSSCVPRPHDPQCIKTPQEYVDLLKARSRGSAALERTACVADNLLGRMYSGPFKPDDWELDPVLSNNPARRIIFAIGPRMLERILVFGHNAADKTVKSLGYGDSFVCGTAPDWKGTCQYRLLVWQSECLVKNYGPLVRGDWANLEEFMREEYEDDLPKLKKQIKELEDKTFQELTACDPDILAEKAWDPSQQAKAGCSKEYIAALAKFPFAKCNDSSPTYSRYTKCPAEEAFLKKGQAPPTTLELRAFLQQTQGFMPQYTGYSYTANLYSDPLAQEFWVHNTQRSTLDNSVVVKMWNDTANAV